MIDEFKEILLDSDLNIRKHIQITMDVFISKHTPYIETLSLDDREKLLLSLFKILSEAKLSYDVKTLLFNFLDDVLYTFVKDEYYEKVCVYLESNDNNIDNFDIGDDDAEKFDDFRKLSKSLGHVIIASPKDDIINYLELIGYDISKIKEKKYFLFISFIECFSIKYLSKDVRIPPLYCKNLNELKESLENGINVDKFDKSIFNTVRDSSYITSTYEDIKDILLKHDRKKLKHVNSISLTLTEEQKREMLSLNIPLDIKIFCIEKFFIDKELFKECVNIDFFKYIEIENSKENILTLEKIGYESIFVNFDKLFLDMEHFEMVNEKLVLAFIEDEDSLIEIEKIKDINKLISR